MATILIAVGDDSLREAAVAQLETAGHATVLLDRPLASLTLSRKVTWDVVCLDASALGIETLKTLAASDAPAPLIGLGLNDAAIAISVPLPVAAEQLIAAVATLTVVAASPADSALHLDADQRMAVADGREVALTRTEYRLLEVLYEHRPGEVGLPELMLAVWGYTEGRGASELVRAHIRNLRLKLTRLGLPDAIRSRRGRGYSLVV